jgi:hypothetical protein
MDPNSTASCPRKSKEHLLFDLRQSLNVLRSMQANAEFNQIDVNKFSVSPELLIQQILSTIEES